MGYWSTSADGVSFAENEGEEMVWGDAPADVMDDALDRIERIFRDDGNRPPTKAEILAGLLFSLRGRGELRDGQAWPYGDQVVPSLAERLQPGTEPVRGEPPTAPDGPAGVNPGMHVFGPEDGPTVTLTLPLERVESMHEALRHVPASTGVDGALLDEISYQLADQRSAGEPGEHCLCATGVQPCPRHPNHLATKEDKIRFRKDWDARVERGQRPAALGQPGNPYLPE
jgi:hypothetical protein